jgi:ElaB/YqjD/DUF883 family membrane-anchored ribosome-binding protein
MSSPEEIQRDIETTRNSLRDDVDRFTEKVSPGRVVGRRVDRVKDGAATMRERVMGAVPDTGQVRDAATTVGDTAAAAPQAVRRQTQGSPLAAGVVAFGIGMVLAGLVPATEREQQLARSAQQSAKGPLQEKAKEIASELRDPAQQAVEQVKETASAAASDTAGQAKSAAHETRETLRR